LRAHPRLSSAWRHKERSDGCNPSAVCDALHVWQFGHRTPDHRRFARPGVGIQRPRQFLFTASDLRRHFRTIERFLYYYLPKETPPDKKQTLTPQAAPHRFFFCPSLSGLQALGYISYRQTDRAGRVGSYFGHVLVSVQDKNDPPWDVLECLQLWNSPGWVVEDLDTFSHGLPSLTKLSDLRGGTLPAVDERVLWSFLNTPPGGSFYCPGPLLLPDRWTKMSVADRRRYFRLALMGYLEISSKERESLLLLIEPQVAVLFFYGIARLLPAGLRAQLSFSTLETNADRLITSLAALTFDIEGNGGDVPPERYRRGFVLNTWQDRASELQDPKAKYADFVLGSLVSVPDASAAALAHTIDQKLARFQQADAAKASDLEEFVKAHDIAEAILELKPNVAHDAWKRSPAQTAYVRKAVRQKLSGPADPAYLTRVLNSPQYLQLMLETAIQGDDDDNCTASLKYLVERVQPLDALEALLGDGDGGGARRYKLHAMHHYVKTKGRLPGQCRWLWTEKRPVGRGPQKPQLLLELVQSSAIDAQLVRNSLNDVPDEGLPLLFRGLLKASLDQSDRNDLLTRIAGRTGFDVVTLVNDIKSELATYGALLGPVLCGPLTAILDHVHEQPGRFGEIMAALDAGKSLLDPRAASRARAWLDLKRTFEKSQKDMPAQQTSLKPVPGRKVWAFTEEVCKCLDRCFPTDPYEVFRKEHFKDIGAFVRQVAATYQVSGLVPEKFDAYLNHYFRRNVRDLKRIADRGHLAWVKDHPLPSVAIGVALACLIPLALVAIKTLGGHGGGRDGEEVAAAPGSSKGEKEKETEKRPGPAEKTAKPDGDSAGPPPKAPGSAAPAADGAKPAGKPGQPPDLSVPPPKKTDPAAKPGESIPGKANPSPPDGESAQAPAAAPDEPAKKPTKEEPPPAAAKPVDPLTPLPESPESGVDLAQTMQPGQDGVLHGGPFRQGYAVRVHGAELLQTVKPPEDTTNRRSPSELVGLEKAVATYKDASAEVSATFNTATGGKEITLAGFYLDDGKLKWKSEAYKSVKDNTDARMYVDVVVRSLKHCVLELKPPGNSRSVFLTFDTPTPTKPELDESGGAVIQDRKNPLNIPSSQPWSLLYLGKGKIVQGNREFEFGGTWLEDPKLQKWPVPQLGEDHGLPEAPTIELIHLGGQVKLVLKPPEQKTDPTVQEKRKELGELKASKRTTENFTKAANPNSPDKVQNLVDAIGFKEKCPELPSRPQMFEPPKDATPVQVINTQTQNVERFTRYQQDLVAAQKRQREWFKDLLAAGNEKVKALEGQVKTLEGEIAAASDGPSSQVYAKFREGLKSGLRVEAMIYRVVPYEEEGEKREIRILVVDPGRTKPEPDLTMKGTGTP
jgi:hypothetical protein